MSYLKNISLLIASPAMAWEEIGKNPQPRQSLLQRLLYPLIAVIAIASFVHLFYDDTATVADCLRRAIVNVTVVFFGYMLSAYLLTLFFPTPAKAQGGTDKLHGVAIYSYVLLGGFVLLSTFLPWYSIIFNFAPFYLVFSLSQGVTYIDGELATGDLVATVKASLAVLLPFYALKVLLSAFLL